VPSLAALNGDRNSTPERIAVWIDGSSICWRRFGRRGWRNPVSCEPHGLSSPHIVEPPLQLRAGAGVALALADAASLVVLSSPSHKRSVTKLPPGTSLAGIVWAMDEAAPSGQAIAFWRTPARVLSTQTSDAGGWSEVWSGPQQSVEDVLLDQWKATASLHVFTKGPAGRECETFARWPGTAKSIAIESPAAVPLSQTAARPGGVPLALFGAPSGGFWWFDGQHTQQKPLPGCRPFFVAPGAQTDAVLCASPQAGVLTIPSPR
jgi:hypothetical protein